MGYRIDQEISENIYLFKTVINEDNKKDVFYFFADVSGSFNT